MMRTRGRWIAVLGLALASAAGRASAQDCAGGRLASDATEWHCCWPGQRWGAAERACIGPPACPEGTVAHGESCVPPIAARHDAPAVAQPFVEPIAAPTDDARVVADGAPGWPSSPSAPTAHVNPRYETEPGNVALIAPGAVLFAVGYVGSVVSAVVLFESDGINVSGTTWEPTNDDFDATCHDTVGATQLIPFVGDLVAMIVYAACRVPAYARRYDGSGRFLGYEATGEQLGMDYALFFAWTAPAAALQLIGTGLFLGGVAGSTRELRVGPDDEHASARVSIQLHAPGAQTGLSLRVDF